MSLKLIPTKCSGKRPLAFHVYQDDVYIVTLESEKDFFDTNADPEHKTKSLSDYFKSQRNKLFKAVEHDMKNFLDVSFNKHLYFANRLEAVDYIYNLYPDYVAELFSPINMSLDSLIVGDTTYIDIGFDAYDEDTEFEYISRYKFFHLLNNIRIDDSEDNAFILEVIIKGKPNFIYNV